MGTIAASSNSVPIDAAARFERSRNKLRAAQTEYERWLALTDGVPWSVDVSPAPVVREEAALVLTIAEKNRNDWNYGNAIHRANIALGRLALREGNIEQAKRYLIEAGKTPGSPQLNSFGPSMLLAQELLEKGESAIVVEYIDLCSQFWNPLFGMGSTWKKLIAEGKRPNFAANLLY